jgi:hypothetical protein
MWKFIKTLISSIYRHTVGGVVRLISHACEAKVDREDKKILARALRYVALVVVFWFFPVLGGILMALRIMALGEAFGIISDVYEDVVTSFMQEPVTAAT